MEFPAAAEFPFSQDKLGKLLAFSESLVRKSLALTRRFHEDFNPGCAATPRKGANSSLAQPFRIFAGLDGAGWSVSQEASLTSRLCQRQGGTAWEPEGERAGSGVSSARRHSRLG